LTKLNSEIPDEFEQLVNKALSKNLSERYQQTQDILCDLEALRKTAISIQGTKKKHLKMSKSLVSILSIVLLLMIFILVSTLTQSDESKLFQIKHTSPLTSSP
jgi:hypothetical protein